MTSRDFCYWLQGFFELTQVPEGLSVEQTKMIRAHLNLVFKHEIDPSIDGGNAGLATTLQEIHDGKLPHPPSLVRC